MTGIRTWTIHAIENIDQKCFLRACPNSHFCFHCTNKYCSFGRFCPNYGRIPDGNVWVSGNVLCIVNVKNFVHKIVVCIFFTCFCMVSEFCLAMNIQISERCNLCVHGPLWLLTHELTNLPWSKWRFCSQRWMFLRGETDVCIQMWIGYRSPRGQWCHFPPVHVSLFLLDKNICSWCLWLAIFPDIFSLFEVIGLQESFSFLNR